MASLTGCCVLISNEQLLVRAGQRDRLAFAMLYDRTAPMVAGVMVWLFADRDRVEALMLTIYLEAWKRAPRYRAGQGHAQAWILTIAWNHALSHALHDLTG